MRQQTGRVHGAGGQYATTATAFNAGDKSGAFSLDAGQGGRVGNVSFGRGNITLQCSEVAGIAPLNPGPLYQVVAPVVNMKKQVLACLDTKTVMSSKDTGIALTGAVISIGDASYDIRKSSNEMLNFSNDGKSLLMTIQMPDMQTVGLGWDGAGQLTTATVLSKDGWVLPAARRIEHDWPSERQQAVSPDAYRIIARNSLMNCCNHPDSSSLGICRVCCRGVCATCATELGDHLACKGAHEDAAAALDGHRAQRQRNAWHAYRPLPRADFLRRTRRDFPGRPAPAGNFASSFGAAFILLALAILATSRGAGEGYVAPES